MSDELSYEDIEEGLAEMWGEDAVVVKDSEPETETVHSLEIIWEYAKALCPGLEIDDRGLMLPDGATLPQVQNLAELFEQMSASTPLMWADTINQAERMDRENFTQILSTQIGRAEGTVRNWRFVANSIPWEMRPDPRVVQMSKLYMIAGLMTTAGKRLVIEMAEAESADTETVKAITGALKTYPEEDAEQQEAEEHWLQYHETHPDVTLAELTALVREDLHERGHLGEDDDPEEAAEPKEKTGAETAEDLVEKLLELAGEAGHNVPQNVLALFASTINASKVMTFTEDAEAAQAAFHGLGMLASHLLQLRLAQIDAGTVGVGCTCEVTDMGGIDALSDCPVHGWSDEEDDDDVTFHNHGTYSDPEGGDDMD